MPTPVPAILGMPGGMEVVVFLAIVLLLFGNRLPGAMRSLGRSVVEFKKGANDAEEDDDKSRDD